jgi:two-component system NtrC family response regulator
LGRYWLGRLSAQHGKAVSLTEDALDALRAHAWPGNPRELRSVLEHAWSLVEGSVLTSREVRMALGDRQQVLPVSDDKRRRAESALTAHKWNVTRAAKSLGINRSTFYRWLGTPRRPD